MTFTLDNGTIKVTGRIEVKSSGLVIYLDGYGTKCQEDGAPIYLEIPPDAADPVLYVWGDIEFEDYTDQIGFRNAREYT